MLEKILSIPDKFELLFIIFEKIIFYFLFYTWRDSNQ